MSWRSLWFLWIINQATLRQEFRAKERRKKMGLQSDYNEETQELWAEEEWERQHKFGLLTIFILVYLQTSTCRRWTMTDTIRAPNYWIVGHWAVGDGGDGGSTGYMTSEEEERKVQQSLLTHTHTHSKSARCVDAHPCSALAPTAHTHTHSWWVRKTRGSINSTSNKLTALTQMY